MIYSSHIFLFPFRWEIEENKEVSDFSTQTSLNSIRYKKASQWERCINPTNESDKEVVFNEKNYFYEFTHEALFDMGGDGANNLMRHYERRETKTGNVTYSFGYNKKTYTLNLKYMNLNLYSTGVGVLSFYLENDKYAEPDEILVINQYGRRIYPAFYNDINNRNELSQFIRIEGLTGVYEEDFNAYSTQQDNQPASFIKKLIVDDLGTNIKKLIPVVDDRMYVISWYKNDEICKKYNTNYSLKTLQTDDFWYKFIFVDANSVSCQNQDLRNELVKNSSFLRWQQWSSFYGYSRYSFVFLTTIGCPSYLITNFETEYVRMAELVLVQRASILRFSEEVTKLSKMEYKDLPSRVNSLHKDYIRFINRIHFREVSAQDQGIEIYQQLYELSGIRMHVEKLASEIQELDNYVHANEERTSNENVAKLSKFATVLVPATLLSGMFGMNNNLVGAGDENNWLSNLWSSWYLQFFSVVFLICLCWWLFSSRKKK